MRRGAPMTKGQDDREELHILRQRVAELELAERAWRERELSYLSLLDLIPQSIFRSDLDGRCVFANSALLASVGMSLEQLLGKTPFDLYPRELAEKYRQDDAHVLKTGETFETIEEHRVPTTGETIYVKVVKAPVRDLRGEIVGIQGIFWDVTSENMARRLSEERKAHEEAVRELSTPLIPIADKVVVMPLIGTIDSNRASQVLETLLDGVVARQASVAILDITGVRDVDSGVADSLVRAARAVGLIGAQVVLTGIKPSVAQTLVDLGVDLGSIVTSGTLQSGIRYALQRMRPA
ncbi:PAS domain-containing protein [Sorangium sp. So ce385]|uniref:PAS domain-containing protein n=1 Tax=Sorangium sp. So ce385 TaxID=3133308 RepID=UPI003F5BA6CD